MPEEIFAQINHDRPKDPEENAIQDLHFPTLLTGEWCPFSVTAASFWGDIAEEVGIELQVVSIESKKGERLSASINATGVPCLIVSQDKAIYGVLHDRRYARKILHSLLKNA